MRKGELKMNIEIDARGLACPRPVILTKKELDNMQEGTVVTVVDNEVAKENISKLAKSMDCDFQVKQTEDQEYYIYIQKGENKDNKIKAKEDDLKDMVIGFSANTMGKGDDKLGNILMKSFIFTVSETKPYPKTLVFYNGGVKLTCEDSQVLDELKKLQESGVEILSCGTCLDYLDLKEKLKIGSISNMYTIYEKLNEPANNLIIG